MNDERRPPSRPAPRSSSAVADNGTQDVKTEPTRGERALDEETVAAWALSIDRAVLDYRRARERAEPLFKIPERARAA